MVLKLLQQGSAVQIGQALAFLTPVLLDHSKLDRYYLGNAIGNPHKAQHVPEPAQALPERWIGRRTRPRRHHPPQLRRLQLWGRSIEGITDFVEQRDVEIRASPEAPQERARRGHQVPGLGVLLAHGPVQLRLHERPGKRGDQPWYDVFEIRIAPDILRAVDRGISQGGNRTTMDNPT